jgi:hypothetical protein
MTLCKEKRSLKKPRRNAFVIRPNVAFSYHLSALPRIDEFFDETSPVEDCSHSVFSLSSEQPRNNPDEDVSLGHVNETMRLLKDGFSDLRLGDEK